MEQWIADWFITIIGVTILNCFSLPYCMVTVKNNILHHMLGHRQKNISIAVVKSLVGFYMSTVGKNEGLWLFWKWNLLSITFKSLFYNYRIDFWYAFEVSIEPLVWIVDHFSKVLGRILVAGVIVLTSTVVYIVYWLGLPHYRDNRPYMYALLMPYGHWLLVNVVFNFYMACATDPGSPVKSGMVTQAVGVCRKCIAPKPPRTHHCSVCNRCVLKMDHHCPWINNCVGHFNHRFFFQYMIFMILGCLFIIIFGAEIAYNEVWLGGCDGIALRDTVYRWIGLESLLEEEIEGYPTRHNDTHIIFLEDGRVKEVLVVAEEETKATERAFRSYWIRFAVTYAGMLCLGCLLSLGLLVTWHSRMITAGETSIEQLINKKETLRLAKLGEVYRNPYNFGPSHNWMLFLGLEEESNRSFWRHILFPSTHLPGGSGLSWPTSYDNDEYNEQAILVSGVTKNPDKHSSIDSCAGVRQNQSTYVCKEGSVGNEVLKLTHLEDTTVKSNVRSMQANQIEDENTVYFDEKLCGEVLKCSRAGSAELEGDNSSFITSCTEKPSNGSDVLLAIPTASHYKAA